MESDLSIIVANLALALIWSHALATRAAAAGSCMKQRWITCAVSTPTRARQLRSPSLLCTPSPAPSSPPSP